MKYTVITATFNSDKTVARTFDSILAQSYKNIEYIVIDGGSLDQTISIIKTYQSHFKKAGIAFKWVSENDDGIYEAWNKGLKMSTGQWISFLGSDDVYNPNAIASYDAVISNLTEPKDFVYSNVEVVKNGKVIRKIRGDWSWRIFRRKMNVAHVGAFHNRDYFNVYGFFDANYKIAGDYELLLRAQSNLKTAKVNTTTAVMAYGGISNDLIFKVFSETIKAKHQTGGLGKFFCYVDFFKEYLIYFIKRIL